MSEPVSLQLLELERLEFLSRWYPEIPVGWKTCFSRRAGSDLVEWTFLLEEVGELPRGYEESVSQRCRLWKEIDAPGLPAVGLAGQDPLLLTCEARDAEPFSLFFPGAEWRADAAFVTALLDVVRTLSRLAPHSRLLSSVSVDDFLIYCRSGVHLEAGFCPVFSTLRNEAPRSDFQIAQQWAGSVAAYLVAAGDGWRKPFPEYDPMESKPFRPLLKEMDRGREKSLSDCFAEIESILLRELSSQKVPAGRQRLVSGRTVRPGGILSESRIAAFQRAYPGKAADHEQGGSPPRFSNFCLSGDEGGGDEGRVISLLLPEKWFDSSVIDSVNRRMSNPFLKGHPNMTRVRSIFCEENFTAIVGDRPGIPLPSVLEVGQAVRPSEILRVGTKLSQAMGQFESADFHLDLQSPWQIEIHPVDPARRSELLESWLELPMEEWPAWDLRLRVERPPESYLGEQSCESWRAVSERLLAKPFPAILIWMAEWKRLEWAARKGSLSREPLSWDRKLGALFEATVEHFEAGNSHHRERFLELLEEGFATAKAG